MTTETCGTCGGDSRSSGGNTGGGKVCSNDWHCIVMVLHDTKDGACVICGRTGYTE